MSGLRIAFAATIVLLIVVLPAGLEPMAQGDVVELDTGSVSGGAGDGYRYYFGIPYAASPVGDLRWKPPQPAQPWSGVRESTDFGSVCPQVPLPFPGFQFDDIAEDCLTINVWSPAESLDDRLPVMVWIHGGGFFSGSGSQMFSDGAALAGKGVVVVTFNYRLGALGFMAHPALAEESPDGLAGNYGLLDQIAALEWVQRNISAFGGDPERVTIFGQSAGGMSVAALMLSPMAEGLFHRAIDQGGSSVLAGYLFPQSASGDLDRALASGQSLAGKLGCDGAPNALECLRAKSPDEVVLAAGVPDPFFPNTGAMMFLPVSDDTVLSKAWLSPHAEGPWPDIPLIIGNNADEGSTWIISPESLQQYAPWVRDMFGDRAEELLALFPADTPEAIFPAFNKLFTAVGWACPSVFVAEARSQLDSSTYLYQFSRVPDWELKDVWGAFHGLDIGYVFGAPRLMMDQIDYPPEDKALSETMMDYWSAFAATGDPNGPGRPHWPAFDPETEEYLDLDSEVSVKSALFEDACDALR